jgi:hypothetical protein
MGLERVPMWAECAPIWAPNGSPYLGPKWAPHLGPKWIPIWGPVHIQLCFNISFPSTMCIYFYLYIYSLVSKHKFQAIYNYICAYVYTAWLDGPNTVFTPWRRECICRRTLIANSDVRIIILIDFVVWHETTHWVFSSSFKYSFTSTCVRLENIRIYVYIYIYMYMYPRT